MMFDARFLTILLVVMMLYLFFPPFAYAYLDPGTGSYIFQLLLAGIVGLLFVIKAYWAKIKLLFARVFSRDGTEEVSEVKDEDA